jgi:hypothetical protein
MRTLIAALVVVSMFGCGVDPGQEASASDAGAVEAVDAGPGDAGVVDVDAGVPDAGASCSAENTLTCGVVLANLMACCDTQDGGYSPPTAAAFCEHVASEIPEPGAAGVACKVIDSLPCAQVLSDGLCR